MFWAELGLDLASTSPDGAQLGSQYGVLPGVQMIQDPTIGLPASLMGLGTSVETGSLTPRTKKAASGDQQESPHPKGLGREHGAPCPGRSSCASCLTHMGEEWVYMNIRTHVWTHAEVSVWAT